MKKNSDKKELETSLKLIVKTSFIVFIGLILSKIFTYAYRIIIARQFDPEVYGLFSLASMILGLFVAVSSFGLPEGILRYVSFYRGREDASRIRYTLRFSTIVLVLSGGVFSISLFFLSEPISITIFHNPSLIVFLKWFSFLIPVSIFLNASLALLRAYEKILAHSFLSYILHPFVNLGILILLVFFGLKSNAIIISYAGGILIALLASFLICKYKIPEAFEKYSLDNRAKSKVINDLLLYSWPLIFFTILSSFAGWIDSLMLGYFKGVLDVGFYNVAITIASLSGFIPTILMSLFYPLTVREFSKRKIRLIREISQQVVKWIFIINLPILILFMLFPGAIINLLFGEKYLFAGTSLRILSLAGLFSPMFVVSINLISMKGKSKLILINTAAWLAFNFLLNLFLIPRYGMNGSALSSAISGTALCLLLILEVKYHLSIIPFNKQIFKILLISIIPTLSLILLKQFFPHDKISVIMQGILFFLFYFLLILLTGCLDKTDFMILKTIKDRFKRNILQFSAYA